MTSDSDWAARALEHTRQLAGHIGPRGSTTPQEKRAADYAYAQLQQMGLADVRLELFKARRSAWLPLAIVFSVAIWGSVVCWAGFYITASKPIGALIGGGLVLFALYPLYCGITFKRHPLRRWLLRETSHNVIGRIPATASARQRVVLIAHLDTPSTSPLFKTTRRTRVFRFLITFSAVSLIVSLVMFVLGGASLWPWAFIVGVVCGFIQAGGLLAAVLADQGEFSPGANDNASGVGLALALAERLHANPLPHTEVWVVCCGSKEVGGEGLRALLAKYGEPLRDAWFIGFEGVGVGDRLIYLTREGPLGRSIQQAALDLVQRTASARPDQAAQPRSAAPRYSVVGPVHWHGFKGVCLSVYSSAGDELPYWRNSNDILKHIQASALKMTYAFAWELLNTVERESGNN